VISAPSTETCLQAPSVTRLLQHMHHCIQQSMGGVGLWAAALGPVCCSMVWVLCGCLVPACLSGCRPDHVDVPTLGLAVPSAVHSLAATPIACTPA
jgi:hypothetical protein